MRRLDTFTFKCSDEERRMIAALAKRLDRSQSDAVRVVLRKAAVEAGAWFDRPPTERYRDRPDPSTAKASVSEGVRP
jgi:hypothetical protein